MKECLLFACFQKDFYNQDLRRLIWGLSCKRVMVSMLYSLDHAVYGFVRPGWYHWVVFLGKTLYSHITGNYLLGKFGLGGGGGGGNLCWTSFPSRGNSNTPSHTSSYGTRIMKIRKYGTTRLTRLYMIISPFIWGWRWGVGVCGVDSKFYGLF